MNNVSRTDPESTPPRKISRSRSKLARRLAVRLIRWNRWLLLLAFIATVIAIPISRQLTLDRSIESLFPLNDPILNRYQTSKSLFGGDEFLIIGWKQPELLEIESLDHIRAFGNKFNELPGVQSSSTYSLATVLRPKGV